MVVLKWCVSLSSELEKFDQQMSALQNKAFPDQNITKEGEQLRQKSARQFSLAVRIAVEMIAALAGSAVLGWFIDRWSGTKPIFLVIFCILGIGVAILNIVKIIRRVQSELNDKPE